MSTPETRAQPDVTGEGDEEPSPLGAAPTLPGYARKERKAERRRSRRAAAERRRDDAPVEPMESGSGVVNVYEPHSQSSTSLRSYVREIWARRQFLAALARSDLRGRRSSTLLGSLWGLLDPIFQATIYYFLFVVIRGGQGRPVEFLPILIGGIFLFRLTMSAMNDGGKSVRKSSSLMLNSNFPRAILPLASVYKGLLGFLPSIVVFAGVYMILGDGIHRGLLWLPLLFCIQMVTGVGLALTMSTLIVFFKDTQNALNYVQRILFFTTPVIWPISIIPDQIRDILAFQPLFPLFANYQYVFGGGTADGTLVVHAACWALFFLFFGGRLFLRHEQEMASRL